MDYRKNNGLLRLHMQLQQPVFSMGRDSINIRRENKISPVDRGHMGTCATRDGGGFALLSIRGFVGGRRVFFRRVGGMESFAAPPFDQFDNDDGCGNE